MPTVIESLLFGIGIDAETPREDANDADEAPRRLEDAGYKARQEIEEGGKNAEQGFRRMREAVSSLYGAISSAYGGTQAIDMGKDVVSSADPFGDLSRALTMNGLELEAWRIAARQSGASAERMAAALRQATGERPISAMPLDPVINPLGLEPGKIDELVASSRELSSLDQEMARQWTEVLNSFPDSNQLGAHTFAESAPTLASVARLGKEAAGGWRAMGLKAVWDGATNPKNALTGGVAGLKNWFAGQKDAAPSPVMPPKRDFPVLPPGQTAPFADEQALQALGVAAMPKGATTGYNPNENTGDGGRAYGIGQWRAPRIADYEAVLRGSYAMPIAQQAGGGNRTQVDFHGPVTITTLAQNAQELKEDLGGRLSSLGKAALLADRGTH